MSRAVLVVVPLVGLVAALLGDRLGGGGVVAGSLLATVAAVLLWTRAARRVHRLAERLLRWAERDGAAPLEVAGSAPWRSLAGAVNAVGGELQAARDTVGELGWWAERLVATVSVPAVLFDDRLQLLAVNPGATALLGLPAEVAPERGASALRVLGSGTLATAVEHALVDDVPVTVVARVGELDVEATATAMDDTVLVLLADRSAQHRVAELRRDFVTNASHELKTPVTAIATLVGALRVADEGRVPQLLERLEGESDRLVALVHDLLDLRRVDASAGEGDVVPVDVVDLVVRGARRVGPAAEATDVTITTEVPRERAVVAGRRPDLQLVVDNLLSNAVKYNRQGGRVVVHVARGDGVVELRVRDTGIGIPRHEVPRVFERFYRVDVARSRATGGTGLGLSIVRHAVEGHGGTITVDSLLGAGTTFTVRLPVEPGSPLPPARDRDEVPDGGELPGRRDAPGQ